MSLECRVLVVDDDLSFRRLIEKEFKPLGYTIKCVGDGEKALEVLDVFRPHIIILDLLLPGMDGFELAKRIKQKPGFQSVHILMVTAVYLDDEDVKRALKGGANAYLFKPDLILTKPVHLKELKEAVEAMRKEYFDYLPERREVKNRILIIDDDEKNRKLLKMRLLSENFDVFEAEDGLKGLEMAESENVDLILLDIKMPKMSGLDLLSELRNRDIQVPIVMMTAYGSESVAVEAFKQGATDYFIKPFDTQMAAKRILEIIETHSLKRSNEKLVERLKSISIDLISRLNVMEVQNMRLEEAYLRHKELADFNQEFVMRETKRIEKSLFAILSNLSKTSIFKDNSKLAMEIFSDIVSMMNLSRMTTIQARLCHPNLKKVLINKELKDTLFPLSEAFKYKDIEIEIETEAEKAFEANIDTEFLKEIVFNLIFSAFMRFEEGGKIKVALHRKGLDGPQISLSFSDSGRTLLEDEMSKIDLDAFGSRFYKVQGESLRISICYYLCETLGWTFIIPNMDQGGTKFRIEIPSS